MADSDEGRPLTGEELDKRFREIAANVTRENAFSSTIALAKLGFGAVPAAMMICKLVEAKEQA